MKRKHVFCLILSCLLFMASCTKEDFINNNNSASDYVGIWTEVYYLYEGEIYELEDAARTFELRDDNSGFIHEEDWSFEWKETDEGILIDGQDMLVKDGNTLLMESINNEGYDITCVFMRQSEIDQEAIEEATSNVCTPGSLDEQIRLMIEYSVSGWAYDYEPGIKYTVSYDLPGLEAWDRNFVEKDKDGNDVGCAMYEIPLFGEEGTVLLDFENGAQLKLKVTDFMIWDRNIIPKQTSQYESDRIDTKMCVYYNHYWYTDSDGWEEEFDTEMFYPNRVFDFKMDIDNKHLIDSNDTIICCERLF